MLSFFRFLQFSIKHKMLRFYDTFRKMGNRNAKQYMYIEVRIIHKCIMHVVSFKNRVTATETMRLRL